MPGLALTGPAGPGVPGGTDPGGDWYLAGVQRKGAYATDVTNLSPDALSRKLKQMEQQMYRHARDLEFEEAARLRDRIHHLQAGNLGLSD